MNSVSKMMIFVLKMVMFVKGGMYVKYGQVTSFCKKCNEFCIRNDEICVKNDELYIQIMDFTFKMMQTAAGFTDTFSKTWIEEFRKLGDLFFELSSEKRWFSVDQ